MCSQVLIADDLPDDTDFTFEVDDLGNASDNEEETDEKTTTMSTLSLQRKQGRGEPALEEKIEKKKARSIVLLSRFETSKEKKGAPLPCHLCGTMIRGKHNLKTHIQNVHNRDKQFQCKVCKRCFGTKRDRESHVLSVHTRQCASCKTYVTESEEWPEGTTKTSVREVLCTCGAVVEITTTYGRRRSEFESEPNTPVGKREARDTKFACGTCGKLFLTKRGCVQHQQCHSDVKNHVCEICNEGYAFRRSLVEHQTRVHGMSEHICGYCRKGFINEKNLQIHITKNHLDEETEGGVSITTTTVGMSVGEIEEETETVSSQTSTVADETMASETVTLVQTEVPVTATETILIEQLPVI